MPCGTSDQGTGGPPEAGPGPLAGQAPARCSGRRTSVLDRRGSRLQLLARPRPRSVEATLGGGSRGSRGEAPGAGGLACSRSRPGTRASPAAGPGRSGGAPRRSCTRTGPAFPRPGARRSGRRPSACRRGCRRRRRGLRPDRRAARGRPPSTRTKLPSSEKQQVPQLMQSGTVMDQCSWSPPATAGIPRSSWNPPHLGTLGTSLPAVRTARRAERGRRTECGGRLGFTSVGTGGLARGAHLAGGGAVDDRHPIVRVADLDPWSRGISGYLRRRTRPRCSDRRPPGRAGGTRLAPARLCPWWMGPHEVGLPLAACGKSSAGDEGRARRTGGRAACMQHTPASPGAGGVARSWSSRGAAIGCRGVMERWRSRGRGSSSTGRSPSATRRTAWSARSRTAPSPSGWRPARG